MKLFQVYSVTNMQNLKVYIAYTLNSIKYHMTDYYSMNSALYDDIKTYGSNSFKKEVLFESNSKNDVKTAYREILIKYRSDGINLYNDMCSYGFVYITTNLINGKKYIGQHRITGNPAVDDNYFGSGINITRAIEKYGIENFKREILCECQTEAELNAKEKFFIQKFDAVSSKDFYNISAGGDFGDTWSGKSYYKRRKFKNRIAESNKKRKRDILKISGSNNPAFGRKWYKDIQTRKEYFLKPDDPMILELGLIPGKFRSKAHNEKIRKAHTGKKKTYIVHSKGKILVNNGIQNIYIDPADLTDYLRQGYVIGGLPRSIKGKIRMNNGSKNFYFTKSQSYYYHSLGYKYGWIKK